MRLELIHDYQLQCTVTWPRGYKTFYAKLS